MINISPQKILLIVTIALIVIASVFGVKYILHNQDNTTSTEFPYESKYINILNSDMHYLEGGTEGETVLFIHGNPTSSYLWRNILPTVSQENHVIAIDLIGMGKSDKPDIDYSYDDHYRYLEAFIEEKKLTNITLVIHDWGSGLGFNYAKNNSDNVKGIVFMEALIMPFPNYDLMPSPEVADTFKAFRTPGIGEKMIMEDNLFIESMLPQNILRELTKDEMNAYREPYPTEQSRKPLWMWPNEVPIGGEPAYTYKIISEYNQWLTQTDTPMLMLYATPGALGNEMAVQWVESNIKNVETVHIGDGLHFIQEDNPENISNAIIQWLDDNTNSSLAPLTQEQLKDWNDCLNTLGSTIAESYPPSCYTPDGKRHVGR